MATHEVTGAVDGVDVDHPDSQESLTRLFRDLRSRPGGLGSREVVRRLQTVGPNEIARRPGPGWPRELLAQMVHPLALLLWVAAGLAQVGGMPALAAAIVVVVLINALFAFAQERHAERAVEALAAYLPRHAEALRDGVMSTVEARDLVPGDVVAVREGDRVCADVRLMSGSVQMDNSPLTGESLPVFRTAHAEPVRTGVLDAPELVFSGTSCLGGEALGLVYATGMATELGRIAALSHRVLPDPSPLETQVKRVARVIAVVAVGMGAAFIPIGTLLGGLSISDSLTFAIGLLVANVPEGLLPTITLALAVGVRLLAREGALVKRISAVETLGSTSVICTDKTGTLTMNRMRALRVWTPAGALDVDDSMSPPAPQGPMLSRLAWVARCCTNATWDPTGSQEEKGDPTELALLRLSWRLARADLERRTPERIVQLPFDSGLRRMTTIDHAVRGPEAHVKGAPEEILPLASYVATGADSREPMSDAVRAEVLEVQQAWAAQGLRLLALADRTLDDRTAAGPRQDVERDLTLVGLVALADPPRPEVAGAVAQCHDAGIRLMVVTGDHGLTAKAVAQQVGIGDESTPVVTGTDLDAMSDAALDDLLAERREVVFARVSPEAKLRIADALRAAGHVVAMTGDGVNDAPALRRADIGVAMGRSGTDVAREAATMVLSDDNFATIVAAVRAGRQVYDNVRKFIVYIFAHATPEIVPFLLYAASGGRIPLPLTVMQILAIDLGTETLPALALGREPAEPGLMARPPRRREHSVITRVMLMRAWLLLGGVSAVLVTSLFLLTLVTGGWTWGDDVSTGPLNEVWRQATTMTFLGIVACQIGTGLAARTQRASLRSIGLTSNPMLLWGLLFEVVFAAAVVLVPPLQAVFGTAVPETWLLAALVPLPVLVLAVDESWRWWVRRGDEHGWEPLRDGQV